VPGNLNVIGSANSNATVSLWTDNGAYAPTLRKGTYFRGELSVDNSTNSLWLTITNVAVLTNGTNPDIVTNSIGNAFLPQTAESFLYDLDGNLTVDGRWTNSWNGENRLISMVGLTNAASASKRRLSFGYDYQGRRITKQVETWTGSAWSVTLSNKFVYDGWNLIAELNGTNNVLIRSYMWGADLSGSLQGAGGVGGLLAENDAVQGVHFVAFDGNGNLATLVKTADGTLSANYEYGPFGELLKSSGAMVKNNPIRFSTKYQDDETDLLSYGYRYYSPSTGRWNSRDPAGETGGINLFCYVKNNSVNCMDILGLSPAGYMAQDEVVYHRGVSKMDVLGPAGSACAGKKIGTLALDVWLDADPQTSVQDQFPQDYSYITTQFKWGSSQLNEFNNPKYIGGGIGIAFIPDSACCCKKIRWEQKIWKGFFWGDDGTFEGNVYVDSPGATRLFGEKEWEFKLAVYCDNRQLAGFNWSLIVASGVPAKVWLNAPF